MARKQNVKTIPLVKQTVSEFKAWIAGIQAFQDVDWVPNINQWQAIQDRIANLEEVVINTPLVQNTTPQHPRTSQTTPIASSMLDQQNRAIPVHGGKVMSLLPVDDGPVEHLLIPSDDDFVGKDPVVTTLESRVPVSGAPPIKTGLSTSGQPSKFI